MSQSDTRKPATTRRKSVNPDALLRREAGVLRAVGYARVSTEYQVDRLSFDVQADQVGRAVVERGWSLADVVREQGSGGGVRRRRKLLTLLDALDAGEYDALVVARLDRLSRSALDFYELLARAHRNGWVVVCLAPRVDMSDPFGKAAAGVAMIFAELERDIISQRQKDSIAARKERGTYKPTPKQVSDEVEERIRHLASEGFGARRIARQLELEGFRPPRAAVWQPSTVQVALKRLRASEAA